MKVDKIRACLIIQICLSLLITAAHAQDTLYVSPSGNDANPGTLAQPFLTLNQARLAVRSLNGSMTGNIYVYLRGGLYQPDSTTVFNDEDSGTNGFDVVYSAYNGEVPVISGGKAITGWTQVSGNLWEAPVSGITCKIRQLYVNGVRANMTTGPTVLARGGYGMYDGLPAGFYVDSLPSIAKNQRDMEVDINKQYVYNVLGVDTIINSGGVSAVLMQEPIFSYAQRLAWSLINLDSIGMGAFSQFVTFNNAYEFLGNPGEFYYDRSDSTVYYTPRPGEVMGTASVFAPVLQTLIKVNGTSLTQKANHIRFTGITFEDTRYNLVQAGNSNGYFVGQGDCPFVTASPVSPFVLFANTQFSEIQLPPAGIEVDNASYIHFDGNTIEHMGSIGIDFRNGVTGSVISGNAIEDIASAGINIGSPQHAFDGDGVREAESGSLGGGAALVSDTNASGGEAVGGLTTTGSSVSFTNVKRFPDSYQPNCMVHYASANTGTLSLYINDTLNRRIYFYPTGGSNVYAETSSDFGAPWFIQNYNFEFGDSVWNFSGTNDSILNDPANARTGNYYAKIVGVGWMNQLVTSGFTVGDYFSLSGWGKLIGGSTSSGGIIGVKCWNVGSTTLLSDNRINFNTSTPYYLQQTLQFQVPYGTATLEIYVWNGSSSTTLLADELSLSDVGNGSSGAYVPGPGWAPSDTVHSTIKLERDSDDIGGPVLLDYIGSGEFTYNGEQICRNDTVTNNYLRQTSYNFLSSPSINAHFVNGLDLCHNDIDYVPYTGISIGWGWNYPYTPLSGNNTVGYNRIQNVLQTQFDGGGIYTNGQQPNSTVSNNFVNGDNTQYGALYFDAGSQGYTITDNVVENVAANVPWLRLNYYAYLNNADSNYVQDGVNNTAFQYDVDNSSISNTFDYSYGSRSVAAQTIVDSSGIQPGFQGIINAPPPYLTFLVNPGFESGADYWVNNGNASIQSGSGINGSDAAVVTGTGGYSQMINSGFTIGTTYTVGGYGEMSNTSGAGYIGVKCHDGSGNVLLEQNVAFTTETTYTQKNTTFIVPSGTSYLEVYIWNSNSNATFNADSLQLTDLVQLVTNPDFEYSGSAWNNLGYAIVRNDSANAYSGSYEVVTTGNGGYNQYIRTGFVTGQVYTISGFGKMTGTPGTGNGNGHIGVKCWSASNSLLLQTDLVYTLQTSYTQQTDTFTIPLGTSYLEVYVWNDTQLATIVADNIVLMGQAVSNPGFESNGNDWNNLGNASIQDNPSNAHSGNYELVTTGNGGYDQYIRGGFIIGKQYTISGYGKMTGTPGPGNGDGHIGVKCWSAAGSLLYQEDLPLTTQTSYTLLSGSVTIPAGTAYLEVYVWNDTSVATIVVDDISLQ